MTKNEKKPEAETEFVEKIEKIEDVVESWIKSHKKDLNKELHLIANQFCSDLGYVWRPVKSEIHRLGADVKTVLKAIKTKNDTRK